MYYLVPECVFCVKRYRQFYLSISDLTTGILFSVLNRDSIKRSYFSWVLAINVLASRFVILMPNVYNFTPVWTPYFIMASRKVIENCRLFAKCMHEKLIFNILCHCLEKRTEWKTQSAFIYWWLFVFWSWETQKNVFCSGEGLTFLIGAFKGKWLFCKLFC